MAYGVEVLACELCGLALFGKRPDAKFCGDLCRGRRFAGATTPEEEREAAVGLAAELKALGPPELATFLEQMLRPDQLFDWWTRAGRARTMALAPRQQALPAPCPESGGLPPDSRVVGRQYRCSCGRRVTPRTDGSPATNPPDVDPDRGRQKGRAERPGLLHEPKRSRVIG